ncbi:hypothetical protein BB559_003764 [Furculomyces boomerangus]|uniref:OPT family small oligopeptide transporter n=2 Tax=Harpellales TaxID=61421 RepID=A0A2T9Y1Z9_9FUNG|nr:hypothetical protein BB559_006535 [Furculomyces boomerangus]PVU92267.1 hypothetical protein BB559_003764 [Furculomyces boomerangus]PWA00649.1 hypothetical protein BB558_003297 [Smittium angustum]
MNQNNRISSMGYEHTNSSDLDEKPDKYYSESEESYFAAEDMSYIGYDEEVEDDGTNELVRAIVSTEDDTSLPVLTFRFWVIGNFFIILSSVSGSIFLLRSIPLSFTIIVAELLAYPMGVFMAKYLPKAVFGIGPFYFTLNPGPFNIKEHTAITIYSGLSLGVVQKLIGEYLIKSPDMIFPTVLVSISLLRSLHENASEAVKKIRGIKFVLIAALCSCIYHFIPLYFMRVLGYFSVLCLIFPNNKIIHQLGSGNAGMGIGSFSLDWTQITAYTIYPLINPLWSAANSFTGFVLVAWIVTPILYYTNVFNFGHFPIYSTSLYTMYGSVYNTSFVLSSNNTLDVQKYLSYSPLKLNVSVFLAYCFSFAGVVSLAVHFLLNYTGDLIMYMQNTIIESKKVVGGFSDIHNRLMRSYKTVPNWWSIVLVILCIVSGLIACEFTDNEVKWYVYLFSIVVGITMYFPIAIVYAVSNLRMDVVLVIESVVGYLLPGQPIGNIAARSIGNMVVQQALQSSENFKMGHYMKIPPRDLYIIQIVGTVVSLLCSIFSIRYVESVVPDLCSPTSLGWSCIKIRSIFSASSIWGLFGPSEIFSIGREYSAVWYSIIIGALAPVLTFLLSRKYPGSWVSYIHAPIIFVAASKFPPSPASALFSAFVISFIFNYWVYRYRHSWWARYNYLLNSGIELGTIVTMTVLTALGSKSNPPNWITNDRLCGCKYAIVPNILPGQ